MFVGESECWFRKQPTERQKIKSCSPTNRDLRLWSKQRINCEFKIVILCINSTQSKQEKHWVSWEINTILIDQLRSNPKDNIEKKMSDWGPVFVAVVLFVLLTPGLLVQVPGRSRFVEFSNFQTSGVSILVHSLVYFALICIFLLAIGVHMYTG